VCSVPVGPLIIVAAVPGRLRRDPRDFGRRGQGVRAAARRIVQSRVRPRRAARFSADGPLVKSLASGQPSTW